MSSVASSSVLFFNLTSLALFPSLLHPLTRLFPARRCLKSYDDFGQKYKPANRVLICNPWRAKTVDQRKNQKSGWKIWFNPRPVRPLVPSRSVRPSTKGPKDRRPKDLSLSGKAKAKLVLWPQLPPPLTPARHQCRRKTTPLTHSVSGFSGWKGKGNAKRTGQAKKKKKRNTKLKHETCGGQERFPRRALRFSSQIETGRAKRTERAIQAW